MSKYGRKLKLTKSMIKKAGELVLKGHKNNTIAAKLRVSRAIFYKWKHDAESIEQQIAHGQLDIKDLTKEQLLLLDFLDTVQYSQAEWFDERFPLLDDHVKDPKNANVLIKLFQIKDPTDWGNRETVNQNVNISGGATLELTRPVKVKLPDNGREKRDKKKPASGSNDAGE